ncbi:MAG: hypothetical protein ACX930_15205 [Erythrobacter sp.]
MTIAFIAAFAAPLALQAATAAPSDKPATFSDLPVAEATAPRCGIAFASVEGWQEAGDPRGEEWPVIADLGAREFFVVAMARLIDMRGLTREDIMRLVEAEVAAHDADGGAAIVAMMPACLALLETSGIQGEPAPANTGA